MRLWSHRLESPTRPILLFSVCPELPSPLDLVNIERNPPFEVDATVGMLADEGGTILADFSSDST